MLFDKTVGNSSDFGQSLEGISLAAETPIGCFVPAIHTSQLSKNHRLRGSVLFGTTGGLSLCGRRIWDCFEQRESTSSRKAYSFSVGHSCVCPITKSGPGASGERSGWAAWSRVPTLGALGEEWISPLPPLLRVIGGNMASLKDRIAGSLGVYLHFCDTRVRTICIIYRYLDMYVRLWEALVVSQRWIPFPTVLLKDDGSLPAPFFAVP